MMTEGWTEEDWFRFWQSDNLDNLVALYRDFLAETGSTPFNEPFEGFCQCLYAECKTYYIGSRDDQICRKA